MKTVFLLLLISTTIKAQKIVNSSILQSTLFFKYKGKSGTGILYTKDSSTYIITAKHIFSDSTTKDIDNNPVNIEIFQSGNWVSQISKLLTHNNKDIDIIVLDIFSNQKKRNNFVIDYSIALSQEIFFCGYPLNMGMDDIKNINNGIPVPFVKKGIVSAFSNINGIYTIFLDAINNKGFSGGPVFFIDEKQKTHIIGIINSYIPEKVNTQFSQNSGIAIAHHFRYVLEILDSHK